MNRPDFRYSGRRSSGNVLWGEKKEGKRPDFHLLNENWERKKKKKFFILKWKMSFAPIAWIVKHKKGWNWSFLKLESNLFWLFAKTIFFFLSFSCYYISYPPGIWSKNSFYDYSIRFVSCWCETAGDRIFFLSFFCSFVETPDWGSYGVVHSCQTFLFSRQSWEVILEQSLVGVDNPLEMEGGLAETCDGFKTWRCWIWWLLGILPSHPFSSG